MEINALILLELIDDPLDQLFIDIVTTEVRVAICRLNLNDAFTDFQNRNIERTATEVEYSDRFVFLFIQPISECGRRWFVNNSLYVQASDLTCILGRLTLGVIEIRRNGDHGLIDLCSEIVFSRLLQLLQDHCRDLRRAILFALRGDSNVAVRCLFNLVGHLLDLVLHFVKFAAHEPLYRKESIFRICHRLPLCDLTNQPVAIFCKCNHGRRRPSALRICYYNWLTAFHYRHDRVRGSEVDSYDFAHSYSP